MDLNKIYDNLYYIDIFKIPTFILYKNKSYISSTFSKILSWIFIIYFCYELNSQFQYLVNREGFIINRSTQYKPSTETLSLNKTSFNFCVMLSDTTLMNNQYLQMQAYLHSYNYTSDTVAQPVYFKMKSCTLDDFPIEVSPEFKALNLQNALCPISFNVELQTSLKILRYLVIQVVTVAEKNTSNFVVNETKFSQDHPSIWFQLLYIQKQEQLGNTEIPFKYDIAIQEQKINVEQPFQQQSIGFVTETEIIQDLTFIQSIESKQSYKYIDLDPDQFDDFTSQIGTAHPKQLANFQILLSDKKNLYSVTFPDFISLVLRILASTIIINYFFAFLATVYNTQLFKVQLIKQKYFIKDQGFLDIFNIDKQLRKGQLKKSLSCIQVKNMVQNNIYLTQMRQTFFSKKHLLMLDLMGRPYESLVTLIDKYNSQIDKILGIKKETEFTKSQMTKAQLTDKHEQDQKKRLAPKKDIEKTDLTFSEYTDQFKTFNKSNLLYNLFDIFTEKYIQDYFFSKFRYEISFDYKEKILRYMNILDNYPPKIHQDEDEKKLIITDLGNTNDPNKSVIKDDNNKSVIIDDNNKSVIKDVNNKSLIKDDNNKSVIKDDNNKSVIKDVNNKSVIKDANNKSVIKDDNNKSVIKDDNNKSVIKDDNNKSSLKIKN